jgi:predicted ATP-dependent endonuclease of OLD family
MSINKITLKNFKCFKETEIHLPKITLLTGANSSGKSSLPYAILAVFQSKNFPLYFSPNGKYVNMGDFEEISFNHLEDNEIEIDIFITSLYSGKTFFKTSWITDDIANKMPVLNYLKGDFITEKFYYEILKKIIIIC